MQGLSALDSIFDRSKAVAWQARFSTAPDMQSLCRGIADDLMDEIPTAVVSPLPAGVDEVCTVHFLMLCMPAWSLELTVPRAVQGYVVLNRPYAFLQWVHNYAQRIPEDYVIMAEPDHIFIVPPPLWCDPEGCDTMCHPTWILRAALLAAYAHACFNTSACKVLKLDAHGGWQGFTHKRSCLPIHVH